MKKFISFLAVIVTVLIALGMLFGISPPDITSPSQTEQDSIPQLSLEGFSEAGIEPDLAMSVVLLSSGCSQLSMVTSREQIYSIAAGLENSMDMRPLSHDLMGNMVGEFGIDVLMVKLERLEEGTYYAKLLLKKGNKILNLDSRPSDAIALAVRTGAPVYVRDELMENYGTDTC